MDKHIKVPEQGEKITMQNGKLTVPNHPIIPFVEGDGTGPDIWRASVRVFDAAAFVDAEAGTVGQVHWFTAQRQNDVFDVIQVTGSYAGARRETDYATIDRIVDSIRINP